MRTMLLLILLHVMVPMLQHLELHVMLPTQRSMVVLLPMLMFMEHNVMLIMLLPIQITVLVDITQLHVDHLLVDTVFIILEDHVKLGETKQVQEPVRLGQQP